MRIKKGSVDPNLAIRTLAKRQTLKPANKTLLSLQQTQETAHT